jgi:hypothetical protein
LTAAAPLSKLGINRSARRANAHQAAKLRRREDRDHHRAIIGSGPYAAMGRDAPAFTVTEHHSEVFARIDVNP